VGLQDVGHDRQRDQHGEEHGEDPGTKTSVISWIWVSWIWVTVWLTRGKRFGRSRCPSIRRLVKKSLGRLRFPEKIHPKGGFCAEKAHSVLMIRHS